MIVGELLVMACKHETIAHEGESKELVFPELLKKGKNMQSKGTIIKKVAHTVMSDRKCRDCKEPIKQNLISKKPNANRCYKCHKLYHDKPNAVSA